MLANRYLIYELKNKRVQSVIPQRFGGFTIDGIIKDVNRLILESRIHLTVDKEIFAFREPNVIAQENESTITFIYGDINGQDIPDHVLLEHLQSNALKGGSIDDSIKSLETDSVTIIKFNILSDVSEKP